MQAALNLSKKRAEAVRAALLGFAKAENVTIDQSQITPVGAGIADPVDRQTQRIWSEAKAEHAC